MPSENRITLLIKILILISVTLTCCHPSKETSGGLVLRSEDFNKFYDKFHSDSLFQVSRIKFPLEGMYVDGTGKKQWTKENWLMMKIRIYDIDSTRYNVDFKKTKNEFTQKAWVKNSGFYSEYRFSLINKKWYLVYVLDQNL